MMRRFAALLPLLRCLVLAVPAPTYPGLKAIWHDDFSGPAGAPPSDLWNIALDVHTNNEIAVYTKSSANLQVSGGGTVQLVPRKGPDGKWTSGRIESRQTFTPAEGGVMQIEASIRLGTAAAKQGIWPAFWLMGDSVHHGTPWPQCGELDVFEQVNGVMTGYGTVHCGANPGGACNEPAGKGGSAPIPDDQFHTWTARIDRTPGDWTRETISWFVDGNLFHTIAGADVGDQAVWGTLAHSPLFIIVNLAVGGDWPGGPNGATMDGYGNMMEVEYAAVYSS